MTFASEASKLLTNKYFLYFIAFLAITNVMGYLVTNKLNAVAFFVLVCILAYNFSKNMTVVLIIAIVSTNLLMVNKSMREGMTNDDGTTTDDGTTDSTTSVSDPPIDRSAVATEISTKKAEIGQNQVKRQAEIKSKIQNNPNSTTPVATTSSTTGATPTTTTSTTTGNGTGTTQAAQTTAPSTTTPEVETFTPAGAGYNGTKRGAIGGPAKAARIDYSTTLEQAYDNLDKMLGSDGLSNLSADTEKLMSQQQKLFGSVEKFLPLIDKAQSMISTLDMDKINSLVGMTDKFKGLVGGSVKGAPVGAEGLTMQKKK
jgi:hypothetical protein